VCSANGAGAAIVKRAKTHSKGSSAPTCAATVRRRAAVAPQRRGKVPTRRARSTTARPRAHGWSRGVSSTRPLHERRLRPRLDAARLTGQDIDILIPHQANVRIIEATAKHANIPMEKVYVNVDRFRKHLLGAIPIALDEAIDRGRVKEGRTALLVAFGAGFTWGSMVVRF